MLLIIIPLVFTLKLSVIFQLWATLPNRKAAKSLSVHNPLKKQVKEVAGSRCLMRIFRTSSSNPPEMFSSEKCENPPPLSSRNGTLNSHSHDDDDAGEALFGRKCSYILCVGWVGCVLMVTSKCRFLWRDLVITECLRGFLAFSTSFSSPPDGAPFRVIVELGKRFSKTWTWLFDGIFEEQLFSRL